MARLRRTTPWSRGAPLDVHPPPGEKCRRRETARALHTAGTKLVGGRAVRVTKLVDTHTPDGHGSEIEFKQKAPQPQNAQNADEDGLTSSRRWGLTPCCSSPPHGPSRMEAGKANGGVSTVEAIGGGWYGTKAKGGVSAVVPVRALWGAVTAVQGGPFCCQVLLDWRFSQICHR